MLLLPQHKLRRGIQSDSVVKDDLNWILKRWPYLQVVWEIN